MTGLEYLKRANELADRGLTLNLHAYQSHVFLDWREMRSTAEHPWDRLCDHLNGRGVADLDEALVNLELQPMHEALRALLEPEVVRPLSDLTEVPRGAVAGPRKTTRERTELIERAWRRCEAFLRVARAAFASRHGAAGVARENEAVSTAFRERLRAAMRLPLVESAFPEPWSTAARRVLPSASPLLASTALWGPVLAWCALEAMAETLDAKKPEAAMLDAFDRLRLREPLAQAFSLLGAETEEGWRFAARVKVLLLARVPRLTGARDAEPPVKREAVKADAKAAKPAVAAPESAAKIVPARDESAVFDVKLWSDPDVRWLTGTHEAEGKSYLVREPYEELLWWLELPELLGVAAESAPKREAAQKIAAEVRRSAG